MSDVTASIPFLLKGHERNEKRLDDLTTGHGQQAIAIAEHEARLDGHHEAIAALARTVDRFVWAALSVSGAILLAIFVAVLGVATGHVG